MSFRILQQPQGQTSGFRSLSPTSVMPMSPETQTPVSSASTPTTAPKKGFLQSISEGLLNGLATAIVTGVAPVAATVDLLEGNKAKAAQEFQPRDMGLAGTVTPIGAKPASVGQFAKQVVGTGLQVGSLLPVEAGASAALEAGKSGAIAATKAVALQGAKEGAMYGAAQGAGSELSKPGSTLPTVATSAVGSAAAGALGGAAIGGLVSGATNVMKTLLAPASERVNQTVEETINKAIRPSVSGKATEATRSGYYSKAQSAFNYLASAKDQISLIDNKGETVIGKSPASLKQLSSAITQGKNLIFNLYHGLQKAAGVTSEGVDISSIAAELRNASKELSQSADPSTKFLVSYINKYADNIESKGTYSLDFAEKEIANINRKLDSFYKNPTYTMTSQATVDAMVGNNLRQLLDETITKDTSPGYQHLKNIYGSLKSIEGDVNKRLIVQSRQAPKGFFDLTDIFSGADIVRGIATLNPSDVVTGGAMRAVKAYIKYMNSPDRMIQNMFSVIEKNLPQEYEGLNARMSQAIQDALSKPRPTPPPVKNSPPITEEELNALRARAEEAKKIQIQKKPFTLPPMREAEASYGPHKPLTPAEAKKLHVFKPITPPMY